MLFADTHKTCISGCTVELFALSLPSGLVDVTYSTYLDPGMLLVSLE